MVKGIVAKVVPGLLLAVLVLAACSPAPPAAAPAPPSAAPVPPAPAPVPAPAKPAVDTEWEKVVSEAQKEGMVMIYQSAMLPQTARALTAAFGQRYGIRLEWIIGTAGPNMERIQTEQRIGRYVADVMIAGASAWPIILDNGWAVPVELPEATAYKDWIINPYYFDPEGHKMVYVFPMNTGSTTALIANTKLVPAERMPKSLQDLLDPWWKGKILLHDPRIPGPGADLFTYYRARRILTDEWWRGLAKQDLTLSRSYGDQADMLARGEKALLLFGSSTFVIPYVEKGFPLAFGWPKEGVVTVVQVAFPIRNQPHPKALRVFLNWAISKEGHELWMKSESTPSIRKDVPSFMPKYHQVPPEIPIFVRDLKDIRLAGKEMSEGLAAKIMGLK